MCTDAYREALTRDYSSTVSSTPDPTPTPTPAPGQRQAAEANRERAKEATVVSGEATDQR